jgi:hypothetical protein
MLAHSALVTQVKFYDVQILKLPNGDETTRPLMTVPDVGPATALASTARSMTHTASRGPAMWCLFGTDTALARGRNTRQTLNPIEMTSANSRHLCARRRDARFLACATEYRRLACNITTREARNISGTQAMSEFDRNLL